MRGPIRHTGPALAGTSAGPQPSSRRQAWRVRAHLRAASYIVASLTALLLIVHATGGWYFSSVLYDRALSAESRLDALIGERRVEVTDVDPGEVTLRNEAERRLAREGVFGLEWEGGWGIISDVLERHADGSVTRRFEHRMGAELRPGMLSRIDSRVYQGDPASAAGIAFEQVTYTGELGEYPAWSIPGEGSTWFIFVHGNGMTPRDGLRIAPAIADAGLPVLIPTYRNGEGAPVGSDGRLTYGKDEWRDLEAAVQFAIDHGAESVVLGGMSMGGAVVAAFLLESELASRVAGVVFDAPMLDFERCVEYQAVDERVPLVGVPIPPTIITAAEWLTSARFGIDWSYTHYLDRADRFATPMLLIHGSDDDDVPVGITHDLQRARPDLVRDVYIAQGAGHTEAWNLDPPEYERRVLGFLGDLGVIE